MLRSLTVLWVLVMLCVSGPPVVARDVELALDPEDWVRLHGPHFELYSDSHPQLAAGVLVDLERFRALFARLAPGLDLHSPAPLRIVAFDGPRSFAPYKARRDGGGTLLLGQFHRHPDANYLLLDGRTRVGSDYSVAFHELTHYPERRIIPRRVVTGAE